MLEVAVWNGVSEDDLQGHLEMPILPVAGCSPSLFPAICGYSYDLPEAQDSCRQIPGKPRGP